MMITTTTELTFSSKALTSPSCLCFFVWNGLLSKASIFGSPLPTNNTLDIRRLNIHVQEKHQPIYQE